MIPNYSTINEFLQSFTTGYSTLNDNFFCLRLSRNTDSITYYKPPYRKDFYFMALVADAGDTSISFDHTSLKQLNAFLVFQSPGLLYSFNRASSANGYLIYFKKDCFSFYRPNFDLEFPFFNVLQTNFFHLNQQKFQNFAPAFEEVFAAYELANDRVQMVASIKLLALLYQLKDYTVAFSQWEQGFSTAQQILLQKFKQLVNNFYLEKRTVEEFAEMLGVTPNYLSQVIKELTGKNALSFISDRIIQEAKSIIQFTGMGMADIAGQLNFTDPANFGKFFKKHTGLTPMAFRKLPASK
jgi:AraC family transcriptional regulator, transcriptional activator of pobA